VNWIGNECARSITFCVFADRESNIEALYAMACYYRSGQGEFPQTAILTGQFLMLWRVGVPRDTKKAFKMLSELAKGGHGESNVSCLLV
jgi:TPR repeat protein